MKIASLSIPGLIAVFMLLTSCGKTKSIDHELLPPGDYEYVSINGQHYSSIENFLNEPQIRYVTRAEWQTGDMLGFVTIENQSITTNGLKFSINTLANNDTYSNGVLTKTAHHTYQFDAGAYTSKSKFRYLGGDSLNFEDGTALFDARVSSIKPITMKFSSQGDELILTTTYYKRERDTTGNGIYERINAYNLHARLRKKI